MLEGRRIVLVEADEIMGASLVQRLELEGAVVHWNRHILRDLPPTRTTRKPVDIGQFLTRLTQVMQRRADQEMPPETGISDVARAVDRQVSDAAVRASHVLLRGGPGLGKLRLARRIHDHSDRRAAPAIILDALAGPVENETLARAIADVGEGSLIIVGIGRLPSDSQGLLLASLRERDFRLIATAGLRLEEKGADHFRSDLQSLLTSHEIVIPALA